MGETKEVRMRQGQFAPKITLINISDKVIFSNDDSRDYWPASNIHPTHDIYPEFDPKKAITPGAKWEFQFNKTGQWRYHDHLNATSSGVIIVKGDDLLDTAKSEKSPISDIQQSIQFFVLSVYLDLFPVKKENYLQRQNIRELVEKKEVVQLVTLTKLFGSETIVKKLFDESNNATKFNCHSLAHTLGRISYELVGERALQNYISLCHSGYQHGVIAAFVKAEGEVGLVNKLNNICESSGTDYGKLTCYHGSGHGLMALVNNDLPGALKLCWDFDTKFKRSNCFVGAFMENIGSWSGDSLSAHPSVWLSDAKPHYPCDALSQDLETQEACYAIQPNWMDFIFKGDMRRVADECMKANNYIRNCFFGYGQEAAAFSIGDAKKIIYLCDLVPKKEDYYNRCILGAQAVVMDFWAGKVESYGKEFCGLITDVLIKDGCYQRLDRRLADIRKK